MSGMRFQPNMQRRAVIFFCLFTLFLLYLVFSCGWYEPAVLVIKGRVLDTGAVIGSGIQVLLLFCSTCQTSSIRLENWPVF
jgi:hypothetical protein